MRQMVQTNTYICLSDLNTMRRGYWLSKLTQTFFCYSHNIIVRATGPMPNESLKVAVHFAGLVVFRVTCEGQIQLQGWHDDDHWWRITTQQRGTQTRRRSVCFGVSHQFTVVQRCFLDGLLTDTCTYKMHRDCCLVGLNTPWKETRL